MKTFTKEQYYRELSSKERAEALVEGPVEIKFDNGIFRMEVEVKPTIKIEGFHLNVVGCSVESYKNSTETFDHDALVKEMFDYIGIKPGDNILYKLRKTTNKALGEAATLKAAKNVKITKEDLPENMKAVLKAAGRM